MSSTPADVRHVHDARAVAAILPVMVVASTLAAHPIGLHSETEIRSVRSMSVHCDGCQRSVHGAGFLSNQDPASTALFCLKCVVQNNAAAHEKDNTLAVLVPIEKNKMHPHRLNAVSVLPDDPVYSLQRFNCQVCKQDQEAGHYRCSEATCQFDVCPGCVQQGLKSNTMFLAMQTEGHFAHDVKGSTLEPFKPILTVESTLAPGGKLDLVSSNEMHTACPTGSICEKCSLSILGAGFLQRTDDSPTPRTFCAACVFSAAQANSSFASSSSVTPAPVLNRAASVAPTVCPPLPAGKRCELCEDAVPIVYCHEHKNWFCADCDPEAHTTAKTKDHVRLPLGGGSASSDVTPPSPVAAAIAPAPSVVVHAVKTALSPSLLHAASSFPSASPPSCLQCKSKTKRPGHFQSPSDATKYLCIDCAVELVQDGKASVEKVNVSAPANVDDSKAKADAAAAAAAAEASKKAAVDAAAESKKKSDAAAAKKKADDEAAAQAKIDEEETKEKEIETLDAAASNSSSDGPKVTTLAVVTPRTVKRSHERLPEHLQLCAYCEHATVVYRCLACKSPKIQDACTSCYGLNHMPRSLQMEHAPSRVLIPGAREPDLSEKATKDDESSSTSPNDDVTTPLTPLVEEKTTNAAANSSTAPFVPRVTRLATVSPRTVKRSHERLPEHLQLCVYCDHATVVYRCLACTSPKIQDACASCYGLNHMPRSLLREHMPSRVLIPGATDPTEKLSQVSRAAIVVQKANTIKRVQSLSVSIQPEEKKIDEEDEEVEEYVGDDDFNIDSPVKSTAPAIPAPVSSTLAPPSSNDRPAMVKRQSTMSQPIPIIQPNEEEKKQRKREEREERERERAAAEAQQKQQADNRSVAAADKLREWERQQQAALEARNAAVMAQASPTKKRKVPPFPDTSQMGVLEHFFSFLSQDFQQALSSSGGKKAIPCLCGFQLPFSTLFKNSLPVSTWSTDSSGYVKSKHWGSLGREEVCENFGATKNHPGLKDPDQCVALVFFLAPSSNQQQSMALNAAQVRSLFGFIDEEDEAADASESGQQHQHPRPRGNFLLQRFIPSPGQHSTMYRLRADWLRVGIEAIPEMKVSVCTNPHARDSKAVMLDQALCVKTSDNKEELMGGIDGSEEGEAFLTLVQSLQAFLTSLGLGSPIRLSVVVAPSRKGGDDATAAGTPKNGQIDLEESIAEEGEIPEEKTNDSGVVSPKNRRTSSHIIKPSKDIRWNFCFADLLQLNTVEAPPAPVGEASPAKVKKVKKPAAVASPSSDTHASYQVGPPPSLSPPPRKGRPAGLEQVAAPRKIVLDSPCCAKCGVLFRHTQPGTEYTQEEQGVLIMLRQILLKWIPNSKYEYPEDLFHDVLGVDTSHDQPNWHKVVVKICTQCREEIRNLRTIPSRTQLAPWSASSADSNIIAPPSINGEAPGTLLALPPASTILPYLSKAPVLHPDAPGFGSVLQPPKAKKSQNVNTIPLGVLLADVPEDRPQNKHRLASSKSAPQILSPVKHAIAGGLGTAPNKPHQPKSKLHRPRAAELKLDQYDDAADPDYEDGDDFSNGSPQARKNGLLPNVAGVPLSPFSSGQRKLRDLSPERSHQSDQERAREQSLAKAIKQGKVAGGSPPPQQSPMRSSKSTAALTPLQPLATSSPPNGGARGSGGPLPTVKRVEREEESVDEIEDDYAFEG